MLAEERFVLILEQLNEQRTVTVQQLCEALHTSESTIRRDLTELDRQGRRVLVVYIFIIAKILSKSIRFGHFRSQRIFIIFVQNFQRLGYKSFLHAKRPPHLCMRWSFLRFCDRS